MASLGSNKNLESGGGMGWGETVLLSYIALDGRDTSSEKYRPPTPVPPSRPPLLTADDLGAQEERWYVPKEERTENTAGNRKGNKKYRVIFFFLYKMYIKNIYPLR